LRGYEEYECLVYSGFWDEVDHYETDYRYKTTHYSKCGGVDKRDFMEFLKKK